MTDTERRTSEQEWDGHLLLLHGTETERRSRLAHWVRTGLEREEKVIYAEQATVTAHRTGLASVLHEHGIDADEAVFEGRLQVLPPRDFYPPGAVVELVHKSLAEGHRGVRLSGQSEAAQALGRRELEVLERSVDRLCRTGVTTSVLCQNDATQATGARLRQAVTRHLTGVRHRLLQTDALGRDLLLVGEVDNTNDALLRETVRAATTTALDTLRVDLARVSFISVAGWRALARGTERYRRLGGSLVLLSVQPGVARIARLIGVDRLAGVHVVLAEPRQFPRPVR